MRIFGRGVIGTTRQDLWPGSGDIPLAVAAIGLSIVSDNYADTGASGGTGARTASIKYLDSSWDEQSVSASTAGVTEVSAGVAAAMRVQGAEVLTTGSGNKNAGVLTIRQPSTADVAAMPAGWNRLGTAVYTIPRNRVGRLNRIGFSSSAAVVAECYLLGNFDESGTRNEGIFYVKHHTTLRDGVREVFFPEPIMVPEKCAVKLAAVVGSTTAIIAGFFDLEVEATDQAV